MAELQNGRIAGLQKGRPSFLQSFNPVLLHDCRLREATAVDAIDGVIPRVVVEPASAEALAAALAHAADERLSVVICGGGTKLGWGRSPKAVDAAVSTRRLSRVLAHPHGDLTATVEAGATVRDVNAELSRHRQWLPIDVVDSQATIGGVLATNDAGPLRHRHGTPRDLLIGIQLALTDGQRVKAGGSVVKNVAGYDLGKLICGSFGSLAAITSATFKLAPRPAASATVVAAFRDSDALARAAAAVNASQLEPAAFDCQLNWPLGTRRLMLQFASTPPAVDAQAGAARELMAADSFDVVSGEDEAEQWRDHARAAWAAPGVVVRASWLPARLGDVLNALGELAADTGSVHLAGRAGVGAGTVRLEADTSSAVEAIERLRAKPEIVGHLVVLRADREVKARVDVWGSLGDRTNLLGAVKQALDPAGILNAGRGPI